MPNSRGRTPARAGSKRARTRKAVRNVSAVTSSAASRPSRRATSWWIETVEERRETLGLLK
jgi:hypothetical protein